MKIWEKYGIYFITAITLILFSILAPKILSPDNIFNLLSQVSMVAIAASAMTMAITGGGFDLSIGSTIAIATCVLGKNIPLVGLGGAIIILLIAAIILGVINGLIITKLKIQTFVATLATMIIYRGIALIYTQGRDATIYDHLSIKVFSSGRIGFIPVPVLMMLIVYLIFYILYKYTPFGLNVKSVGSNIEAARISGIKVDLTIITIFILTSVTTAISGIILTSQLLTGNGRLGQGFELDVITATILGGTALSGGRGNIWGTLVAAIMLGIVKNGLNLLGVPDFYQRLAIGLILLIALSINSLNILIMERKKI
jgi:ribose transport system permease protein